jgi:hypothetical protein
MPAIDEERILEKVVPEQVLIKGYYEFYYYPGNKNIAISRDGKVLDFINKKLLKGYINQKREISFIIKINGKTHFYKLHRLLSITFLGRPRRHFDKPHSRLEVNHIDGDKLNNVLINLEWCTRKENIEHSHKNNLHAKDREIIVKNSLTGEELIFYSCRACARHFSLPESTIRTSLNKCKKKNEYKHNNLIFKSLK